MTIRRLLITSMAFVVLATNALTAGGASAEGTTADVFWFPGTPQEGEFITDAYSTLHRTESGVTATLHTSELESGEAVTLWWVIFNNPEACSHPEGPFRCGVGDILAMGGDEEVDGTMVFASGHVIGEDGMGDFGAYLATDDLSNVVLDLGSGLANPLGADIHLVVRTHGPEVPELSSEQLQTFGGGCNNAPEGTGAPGDFECVDLQASVHEA